MWFIQGGDFSENTAASIGDLFFNSLILGYVEKTPDLCGGLAGITPYLREEQRAKAIMDAIDAMEHVVDFGTEETMFGLVGPLIGAAQRDRAITMAESQYGAILRARALCGLNPFFTLELTSFRK